MKFAFLLVTIVLGPNVSSANEVNSADADGIMPDQIVRTGEFKASFTLTELLGTEPAERYQDTVPPDEPIEWEVYVPETYSAKQPAGILVYISPSENGRVPKQWKSLMDEHNLIWIGANNSGNRVLVPRRMVYALMALAAIDKSYKVDVDRVYLTGFSGGGKVASFVAAQYPQVFKGAIFNCGVNFWGEQTPERLEQIRANPYVFITGTYDQNLEPTKKAFRGFQSAGVLNSKLMVIRDMGHTNPNRHDFKKAIEYLDTHSSD